MPFSTSLCVCIFCDLKAGAQGVLMSGFGLDKVSRAAELDDRGLFVPASSVC